MEEPDVNTDANEEIEQNRNTSIPTFFPEISPDYKTLKTIL